MRVLAVHTASARLSICLAEGEQATGAARVLLHEDIAEPRDQGNFLLHTIIDGVAAHGLQLNDIDIMVAVTGPGSFTGIRIGLAALRGFTLAADVKLGGVNSFDLFAQMPISTAHRLVVIESWRDELYMRLDDQAPVSIKPNDVTAMLAGHSITNSDITVMGDAAEKVAPLLPGCTVSTATADARTLADAVIRQPALCGAAEPYYLREADVSFGRANRTLQHDAKEVLADGKA